MYLYSSAAVPRHPPPGRHGVFTKEERMADKTLGNPDKGSCAYPGELGSATPRSSARLARINDNKSPTTSTLVDSAPLNKKAKKKMQSDSPPSSEGGGASAVSAIAKPLIKRGTEHRMRASNAPSHKQKASAASAITKTLFKRGTKHRMRASNAPSHKQKAMRK